MCNVANNCKHNTIIGWVVIVVERELEAYLFCDKVQEIIMDCYGANRLMNRPFVENRPVVAITPRGKVKDGFLIGHDGVNATIKELTVSVILLAV